MVWNILRSKGLIWYLKSCKLYHKTTWFETDRLFECLLVCFQLQIISQNYVVWNLNCAFIFVLRLGCKLYHKTTWFETLHICQVSPKYFVVANYITKLRGLKLVNTVIITARAWGCKLYHKTTWFETFEPALPSQPSFLVANYITKLRGLKRATYNHCVA